MTLTLQQFRSYTKEVIQFSSGVTCIIGPNTAGKTNILEAIYILAVGKSFRAEKESDMVRWGEEVGRVGALVLDKIPHQVRDDKTEDKMRLELVITTGEVNGEKAPAKKYLVNGVPRRQIDFVGNIRAVLFSPEDLDLVTDSPSLRRQYLNSVLVQTDREYRRNLLSYERGLRQRNKLLDLIGEGRAGRSQLLFWNQLLIKSGSYLTQKREEFIEYMNGDGKTTRQEDNKMGRMHYQIVYDKSLISEARLEQYKDEEIAAGSTLVGPQRDDIRFEIFTDKESHFAKASRDRHHVDMQNDAWRDVSRFGSRGEQRLAVLWLKLAELSYIEKETEERPILLLDDIFSELDEESRTIVLSVIDKQQTIITSAEEEVVHLFKNKKGVEIIRLPIDL